MDVNGSRFQLLLTLAKQCRTSWLPACHTGEGPGQDRGISLGAIRYPGQRLTSSELRSQGAWRDQRPMLASCSRGIPGSVGEVRAVEETDVMEYLLSDVVTITRRELRAYRGADRNAERILARYSGELRDLLDAAVLGAGPLAEVEDELALGPQRRRARTQRPSGRVASAHGVGALT